MNYGPATIIRREKEVENTERKLTARETQPRKTDVTIKYTPKKKSQVLHFRSYFSE